jgi:parvulin-like peptidyl-prolyl isomerase
MHIITEFREAIKGGKITFGHLATIASDCTSASEEGALGAFVRGDMTKEFETAAYLGTYSRFNLDIHEISQPVVTASGVHLILRTA